MLLPFEIVSGDLISVYVNSGLLFQDDVCQSAPHSRALR